MHSDYEREAIFQLVTNIDLELGQLLTDLREMSQQTNACSNRLNESSVVQMQSDNLNETIHKNNVRIETTDVMQQITRILNCHTQSLNWIHYNTREFSVNKTKVTIVRC